MHNAETPPGPHVDLAILIVNGRFNYKDRLWLELSVGNIIRRTSPRTTYRIFVWNHDRANLKVLSFLNSVRDQIEVLDQDVFDVASWPGMRTDAPEVAADYFAGGCHVHRAPLQILFEHATSRFEVETVFTFDTDAWPLRDNWELPLLERLRRDIRLAGVWRDELEAVIPPFVHPSCLGIRTDTVRELGLRFDREPRPPREDTLSHFTSAVSDRFGPATILRLCRTNRFQYHPVFNGVYGGLVYHHHLGTRYRDGRATQPRTYGWQERGESLDENKLILDATTDMVFGDTDGFCCDLQFAAGALRLKKFIHLQRNRGGQEVCDTLMGEATTLEDQDAEGSDFILGLIGHHLAGSRGFLALQGEVCLAGPRAWEEVSWRRLAASDGEEAAARGCLAPIAPADDQGPAESLGLGLKPGDRHYRAFIGPPQDYDLIAAMTFNLLTTLGLRQHHQVLDMGCGSLRIGRLLIPYLNAGNYAGIEPNEWLVREGIEREIGRDLVRIKQPRFFFTADPTALPAGECLDFAVAQSVLSHCTLDLVEHWLTELRPRLKAGGALLATFRESTEDFSHPQGIGPGDFQAPGWIYPKCPGYRAATLGALAVQSGLRFQVLDWRHPRQTWALFAREGFDSSWFADRPLTWNSMVDTLLAGRR